MGVRYDAERALTRSEHTLSRSHASRLRERQNLLRSVLPLLLRAGSPKTPTRRDTETPGLRISKGFQFMQDRSVLRQRV